MIRISYLLLLVMSSYSRQNTTQVGNSNSASVLVDLIQSAVELTHAANKTLRENVTPIPNTDSENGTKQTVTNYEALTEQPSCTHWLGGNGTCVLYYRCNDSSLYDDQLFDVFRGLETNCSSYLDVCCLPAHIVQDSPTVEPDVIRQQTEAANETLKENVTPTANAESETGTNRTVINYEALTEQLRCRNWSGVNGTCVPYYRCNESSPYEDGLIDLPLVNELLFSGIPNPKGKYRKFNVSQHHHNI